MSTYREAWKTTHIKLSKCSECSVNYWKLLTSDYGVAFFKDNQGDFSAASTHAVSPHRASGQPCEDFSREMEVGELHNEDEADELMLSSGEQHSTLYRTRQMSTPGQPRQVCSNNCFNGSEGRYTTCDMPEISQEQLMSVHP